jgi:hypothetical protein
MIACGHPITRTEQQMGAIFQDSSFSLTSLVTWAINEIVVWREVEVGGY